MARSLEVALLHISVPVADKIVNVHGITPSQVRQALERVGRLPFRWDHDVVRGDRALVMTVIDDKTVLVVLYPAKTGNAKEWWLGSAYPCPLPV